MDDDKNLFNNNKKKMLLHKEFLPSLNQENLIYNEIFQPIFYQGLYIKSSTSLDEDSELMTQFFLQPTSRVRAQNQNGQPVFRTNQTAAAKFTYTKSNTNGKIMCCFGTNPSILVNVRPVKPLSISSFVHFINGNVKPTFSISYGHKYFHPTFKVSYRAQPLIGVDGNKFTFFQASKLETLDASIMVGTHNFSGGLQVVQRYPPMINKIPQMPPTLSFSALVQRKWDKNMFLFAFVRDKPTPANIVWRYIREINKNWKAGVQYSMNTMLESILQVTYSAEIGKATVFGSINTEKIVQSSFEIKLSKNFTFGLNGFLNHNRNDYKLGISFEFDNQ